MSSGRQRGRSALRLLAAARRTTSVSRRSAAVAWVDDDGQRYLVAPRGNTEWVRNVKAAGGEAVLKHGKSDAVRLEELPVEQRAPLIQAYLKKTARVTKREFGIEPDAPIEEFQRIAPDHPVFRITSAS